MLSIELIGHDYRYQVDEIIDLFIDDRTQSNYKLISYIEVNNHIICITKIYENEVLVSENVIKREYNNDMSDLEIKKISKRILKLCIYKAFKKIINKDIHWGILTGIRPTKIVREMINDGYAEERILNILLEEYEIDTNKAQLLIDVSKTEKAILDDTKKNSVSLYIGIPFCPTRCLYCSFTSNSIQKYGHLMDRYLEALIKEIGHIKDIINMNDWNIQTIYIGGGTPTSLGPTQLDILLTELSNNFKLNDIQEITIEAGRPDTITFEKLKIIKKFAIDRISINPQTMNNETLNLIGRNHTPQQIINSFYLAREVGINNINMDIILGLPGEDEKHVIKTMDELQKLSPESITVHTLAIKRASKLKEDINIHKLTQSHIISNMIDITSHYIKDMNMYPYYMYRQKDILGNFENVGYSKKNYECIYNIQIIEETQTIIAAGAGSVSKVVYPLENRIERIFNVKNVEQYILRIDEMIERKNILYY